jgi:hypothetical protein
VTPVRQRSIERFDHEERFAANVNGPVEIRRTERLERAKRDRPPFIPALQDVCARFMARRFEFTVAITIGVSRRRW